MRRTVRFAKGDTVRYHDGKVDWSVLDAVEMAPRPDGHVPIYYIIESGMSGRRYTAWPNELRKWVPGE